MKKEEDEEVRKFSESVTKTFFYKQYATLNNFCEFKSSNY